MRHLYIYNIIYIYNYNYKIIHIYNYVLFLAVWYNLLEAITCVITHCITN